MAAACVLYKWPEHWNLPSLSPACIQAEAYLRLAQAQVAVEPCTTSGNSPTGQLPAFERHEYVSPQEADDFAAARAIIAYARKNVKDLDAQLPQAQHADVLAYSVMVDARLNVATTACIWLEPKGFAEFKKAAYTSKLPFPLNHLIPWSQQRVVRQKTAQSAGDMDQVYADACGVIGALAEKLRASGGPYLLGALPSSLDALVVGHLLFYRHSPAAAPVLQEQVSLHKGLCDYLDAVLKGPFARPLPSKAAAEAASGEASSSSWSSAAKGERKAPAPKAPPTQAELEFMRNSRYWMLGAGAAVAGYVVLSGRYVQVLFQQPSGQDAGDQLLQRSRATQRVQQAAPPAEADDDDDGDDDGMDEEDEDDH